jgi:hypothetical protein
MINTLVIRRQLFKPLRSSVANGPSFKLLVPRARSHTYTTAAEKDELQLSYPEPSQSNHHDLASFQNYASRVGLDLKSTTYVGTRYEYVSAESLFRLGMSLRQVGGSSDFGIDLLGTWDLPTIPLKLKVIAQCKALARAADPKMVRELEGAFAGAPAGWRENGVLGLLVTQKEATKGVRDAIGRSRWPMGFVMCNHDGKILQMLWNRRAEEEGLLGVGVGLKYSGGSKGERELFLTWKGEPLDEKLPVTGQASES